MKQGATLDSSFWINAHRSGLLPYVLARYELNYAPEVAEELSTDFASGREFWRLSREGVLLEAVPATDSVETFGPGERAAMNLALDHRDWVLLMDDRRPLLEAQRRGINVVCTPALVVDLFGSADLYMPQALEILARLSAMQTVSPTLIEAALAQIAANSGDRE